VFQFSFTKRVWVALISLFLFSYLFSLINYVPERKQLDDVYYFSISELFSFIIVYSAPVYLLGGITVSYLIEWFLKKKSFNKPMLISAGLYSISGLVLMVIYIFAVLGDKEVILNPKAFLYVGLIGIGAALTFFFISLLFYYIGQKFSKDKTP